MGKESLSGESGDGDRGLLLFNQKQIRNLNDSETMFANTADQNWFWFSRHQFSRIMSFNVPRSRTDHALSGLFWPCSHVIDCVCVNEDFVYMCVCVFALVQREAGGMASRLRVVAVGNNGGRVAVDCPLAGRRCGC